MRNDEKRTKVWVRLTAFALAALLFAGITWAAAWLFMPQRKSFGSLWEQYLQEPKNSIDVLFFGSSLAYCDVVPARIWEESGLTSWVMAGPEQTMPITFYYVREALKTQTPRIIVLEASALLFKKYENYSKANIAPMPLSLNRLVAVFQGAEKEEWKGLLFPLFNYHYRWTEIERKDVEEHLHPGIDRLAGYNLLTDVRPQTPSVFSKRTIDPPLYEENLRFLEKLRDYCDGQGIRLLLYLAPAVARTPRELTDRVVQDVKALDMEIMDLSDLAEEIGIDNELDWYDGLHFNLLGAEKFSEWWGTVLQTMEVTPGGKETELWQSRVNYLDGRRRAMLEALE
jgi:hypothetical protein